MSATTLNPAHLAAAPKQVSNIGDPPGLGGSESRMSALSRTVRRLKTPIPHTVAKSNSGAQLKTGNVAERQHSASEQVDAAELSMAVSLRGTSDRRKLETRKDNIRFFKALTNGQPDFMEMHVRSVIDTVINKSNPKSLVDLSFPSESGKQRALLKFILMEVAIASPDLYELSDQQCDVLIQARNQLYERHGDYIEQSKLAIDLAEATAPKMRIGLKQTVKAFQMLPDANQQMGDSMAGFLKMVMSSPNKDVVQVLKGLRTHWLSLAKRDRNQYASDIAKYRQFILSAKINQIDTALTVIAGLDKIAALCNKVLGLGSPQQGGHLEQHNA